MGERTHTHSSVSYSWARTTHVRPASSPVLSPVFSLNIRGDVTPPTAETRSSSRGPSTPPHLPQLSPPARGWASHPQQQPDIGSFLSFFLARKGRAASGKERMAAEIPAPNLGGPPEYDGVCVKRPPGSRGMAPWHCSRNH